MTATADKIQRNWLLAAVFVLAGAAFAAYANVWPDSPVVDDRFFVGEDRFSGIGDIPGFFTEDLWAGSGVTSGHYRPVLLLSIWLDWKLHGASLEGYRLTNILLHVLVTLTVFGWVLHVLRTFHGNGANPVWCAFLAALVFAVHPVHGEVVNSVFNRSSMLVALSGVAGLWWLFARVRHQPFLAWAGMACAYFVAMLSKESAVVLPGIAAIYLFVLTDGNWRARLRASLPVLCLLVPLALYFWLRMQALTDAGPVDVGPVDAGLADTGLADGGLADAGPARVESDGEDRPSPQILNLLQLPTWNIVLRAASVWADSLRLVLWPHPLTLEHAAQSRGYQWLAFVLQAALVFVALAASVRRRFGLLLGLAFFYLAFLPASRLVGAPGEQPHLVERYLYFPSVGLTLLLALALGFVERRLRPGAAGIPVLIAVLALTPVCWARNSEWVDEVTLYESEYHKNSRSPRTLQLLTAALLPAGNHQRVVEICDRHEAAQRVNGKYSNQCAIAYALSGQVARAERAFINATLNNKGKALAHANLARFYLRNGRQDDARTQLEAAIEAEREPARIAFREGELRVLLQRGDRARMIEARKWFEEALRLDPYMTDALRWKRTLDKELGSAPAAD
ncbi:hypothetical protein [Elongatibacter sediminis]|uniref:Glycosyltransferase RgtA/B/C/D-like domain-containing protein n=1 Tax=Elongatibacter sediminis TaxID=3119006 RepID=A0AAW9RF79_9GAMM